MEQSIPQNPQLNNQLDQQEISSDGQNPDLSKLNLDGETLQKIYEDSIKAKRTSGFLIIALLLILVIGVNVLNQFFFRNSEITKYSIYIFFIFLFPTLFTKFDLLQKIIEKWFPYLQEPDDFFKRVS